ncbi:YidC/Oxa1 family membrane protein insertase [Mycoplasma testudineum]|uniref:YidC/Oxa1 family membrane protein insertase n=1 Tax=Mycoplasma testudineum TaxID=244584 RepID=A0A4R6IEC0_9MOLU|nr:membrane protein insertase YidC [Mycoplasma testudineum]OYD26847.1 membrane protein insertase YidC [Mycoplasma testudineum]TDO20382.1 YidC/Oxa1 family membrane protein insertase [Mycoplasma testudineum]
MAQSNKRSKNYDFFTQKPNQNPQKERKTIFRRVLFVLKIFLYIFLAGITLTGCVQSFVISTTTQSGQGVEFYGSTSNITPHTNVFVTNDPENSTPTVTNSNNQNVINNDTALIVSKARINIAQQDENIIRALADQNALNGGQFGQLGVKTSAVELSYNQNVNFNTVNLNFYMNQNGEFIANQVTDVKNNPSAIFYRELANGNKQYLFFNSNFTSYQRLYETYSDIYAFSTIANSFVPNSLTLRLNDANNYVLVKPYLLRAQLDMNNASIVEQYNRDVVETVYRFLLTKNSLQNITTITGQNQTVAELIEQISNNNNYTTSLSNSNIIESQIELSASQAAALKTLTSMNNILRDAAYSVSLSNATNSSIGSVTSVAGLSNFDSFGNYGYSTAVQDPIVTWEEAWKFGPFYALVIFPVAKLTSAIATPLGASGWGIILAIIIVVLLTRLLVFLFTFRAVFSQQRMQDMNSRKAKIEAKYAQYDKSNKTMSARKNREIQEMYKKAGISTSDTFISILYTTPIFLAVWRVIQSIPLMKSNEILGINFATTSYQAILNDQQWQYLGIMIVAAAFQIASQILPRLLARRRLKERTNAFEQQSLKKSNKMQNIMMIIFVIVTLILQAGVQIYWIIGAIWTIGQTLFVHYIQRTKLYRERIITYLNRPRFIRWKV